MSDVDSAVLIQPATAPETLCSDKMDGLNSTNFCHNSIVLRWPMSYDEGIYAI